ncbi:MAG: hypothetical protein HW390_3147 [Candidatus Brocadiaceae bacterium]|nr:hypothetical protein [Candidatus Brocadiaceae bacterium]
MKRFYSSLQTLWQKKDFQVNNFFNAIHTGIILSMGNIVK